MKNKINEILENIDRKVALKILSEILDEEYDLRTASNMVKMDCEPSLSKEQLIEQQYGEGNEEAGYIDLVSVLNFAEEVLNCDEEYGDVEFQYFVRPETKEEIGLKEHDDGVCWFVEDNRATIQDLQVQFEMS